MHRLTCLLLPLVLFSCSRAKLPDVSPVAPSKADTLAAQPFHDGDALTAEEKTVRAFILDNADDPKSVEFAHWGPNADGEGYRELVTRDAVPVRTVVRVRWRENNKRGVKELWDSLFTVNIRGRVVPFAPFSTGDDWQNTFPPKK